MDRPTSDAVRAALPAFDWEDRGYGDADPDPLDQVVDAAVARVELITARDMDSTMPAKLAPVALEAAALTTAQLVVQSDPDYLGTINDDSLAAFSIGPYSETRRDPTKTPSKGALLLNPWPRLNDALWLLLGLLPGEVNAVVSDKYDYWITLLTGLQAPAWALEEIDWTGTRGLGWWGLPEPIPFVPD